VISPSRVLTSTNRLHRVSYPYLTSINSVLPAIIAGNTVLLKPSPQTPLTAERLALALYNAGLPKDVLQVLHLSPLLTTFVIQHSLVDFVSFTGSVVGGRSVEKAAVDALGFKGVALEASPSLSFLHLGSKAELFSFTVRREGPCLCKTGCGSSVHRS
jgi:hypothetical protein